MLSNTSASQITIVMTLTTIQLQNIDKPHSKPQKTCIHQQLCCWATVNQHSIHFWTSFGHCWSHSPCYLWTHFSSLSIYCHTVQTHLQQFMLIKMTYNSSVIKVKIYKRNFHHLGNDTYPLSVKNNSQLLHHLTAGGSFLPPHAG